MPWNDKSGGGGGPWGGGNNPGPWGQGPKGPSGPQGSPPDLEDIIRRGQDRLRRALPGGAGASPAVFGLIAAALIALWAFKAVYTVQPDEVAVELRFGVPKAEFSQPGLHFHWWPIETVETANIAEQLVNIGGGTASGNGSGLMLSGDQNIVNVQFSVAYQVSDPRAYLFDVSDPDGMLRQVAESAMREAVGRRPAQDIFRDDREGIAASVREIIQTTLDGYKAGLNVNAISIEDAAPPREVADAFDEVQRAEQDEDKFVEQANQYSNQKLGQARGEAAQIREEAAGYKNRVVQEAEGEAQRFISVYDEYAKAPDVTRQRLYLETMERVLRDSSKVIIEQGSGPGGRSLSAAAGIAAEGAGAGAGAGRKPVMANRLPIIAVIAAVVLFLLYSSVFVVNARQQALVLRFGEIVDVKSQPGIYFKAPFAFFDADSVQLIENRVLRFDLDNIRVQVSGGKFYEVDAFIAYRISDPRVFRSAVSGQIELAEARLEDASRRRLAPCLRSARLRGGALGRASRDDARSARSAEARRHVARPADRGCPHTPDRFDGRGLAADLRPHEG